MEENVGFEEFPSSTKKSRKSKGKSKSSTTKSKNPSPSEKSPQQIPTGSKINNLQDFEKKQGAVGQRSLITISVIVAVMYLLPSFVQRDSSPLTFSQRMEFVLPWILLPVITLLFAVLNMMLFRVHSPADIDAALAEPSPLARVYQSIIQNTLEQTTLAIPIYTIAGAFFPVSRLIVIPFIAILFFLGRLTFFIGYKHSAPGRSIGFTLTCIPTILLLLEILVRFCLQE